MISRYSFTKTRRSDTGKQVLSTLKLPNIEEQDSDVYVITTVTDRLDILAHKYYGNAKYWWVLAVVNNLGKGTLMVEPGIQIRIPANPSIVIDELEKYNQ